MICKVSFSSEMPNTISLCQGDKIYVVERLNQDWWFVRKKITQESGFVPAELVVDTVSYTHYIDDSIDNIVSQIQPTECSELLLFCLLAIIEICLPFSRCRTHNCKRKTTI